MLKYSELIKKSRIYDMVLGDVKRGALGHCYLLVSGDSVAVDEFFDLVACTVYCEDYGCLRCVECERVLNRNNVDVVHLYPNEGKNYSVGDVVPVLQDVYKKSYSGGKKLYFFHKADKMKSDVQNKLLKILEEPPRDVHFFLSTTTEGAILDTVKSRSRKIFMDYFESSDVADVLSRAYRDVDLRRIELSASCCGGSLEKAEKLLSDLDFYQRYNEVFKMLVEVKKSSDVIKYSKTALFDKSNISNTLDTLEIILRDVLAVIVGSKDVTLRDRKTEVERLASEFTTASVVNVVEKINLARKKINAYCSANAIGETLLYAVLEVKFKCQKL